MFQVCFSTQSELLTSLSIKKPTLIRPGLLRAIADHFTHLFKQIIYRFELPIYAGEADVSHFIESSEAFSDHVADVDGFDFTVARAEQFVFDVVNDLGHLIDGDGAFVAGFFQAGANFVAVEGDAGAVFFDDHEFGVFFDVFVGGESFAAGHALAATANRFPAVG